MTNRAIRKVLRDSVAKDWVLVPWALLLVIVAAVSGTQILRLSDWSVVVALVVAAFAWLVQVGAWASWFSACAAAFWRLSRALAIVMVTEAVYRVPFCAMCGKCRERIIETVRNGNR